MGSRPLARPSFILLLVVAFEHGGCRSDSPVAPHTAAPGVSFRLLTTLPGFFPRSGWWDSWSPVGKRLAYESWNGSGFDLQVYDAEHPSRLPVLVHSGDYVGTITWSPDSQWILCSMQAPSDRLNGLFSLVAFPVVTAATPHVLLSRADVGPSVWAANGRIYYWDALTGLRHRLEPPLDWSASNSGTFPDRTVIVFTADPGPFAGESSKWFHSLPEEEGRFDYRNPVATEEIRFVTGVFPDRRRFIAIIPTRCGITAVVDEHGRIITPLWSGACDEPPFEAVSVTSDGRFVVGISEREENDYLISSILYLADAAAEWRVRIENAPQGWFSAVSKTGYSLAFETIRMDSIHVGELEFTQDGK